MKTKANTWDRVVGFFSARSEFDRTRLRIASSMLARKYEGAASGRRTKNWHAPSTSANTEVEGGMVVLRNRARQLVRDNPYASTGVQAISTHVVGPGIFTEVKVDGGQKNATGRTAQAKKKEDEIERIWKTWAENPSVIDYDGKNDFAGIQRLVMRSVVESGEVLVRMRRTGRRKAWAPDGNLIEVPPIQFQVLEGDFLDMNGIAQYENVPEGNTVIQGIEFSPDGQRVAYHMFQEHPGNGYSGFGISLKNQFRTVRVLASEVLHIYRMDRAGQIRGVTWFAPIMIRMKDFDEYEDAQLVRQKIAAMFAVFIKDIDGVDAALSSDGEAELGSKVEPGIIEILPPGKDISFANPPGVEGYGEYTSTQLHAMATGLGITYEVLTGDMSQVNFSSARMGSINMYRNIQEWRKNLIVLQLMDPAFGWFLDACELIGVDTTRCRPVYTAPRREMVDPKTEIAAQKDAVRAGFMTLSEVVRNGGYDPENHFKEIEEDNARLDKLKLVLDTDPRQDAPRLTALGGATMPGEGNTPAPAGDKKPAKPAAAPVPPPKDEEVPQQDD